MCNDFPSAETREIRIRRAVRRSPSFLACEALVKEREDFGHVKLDIFEVEGFLIVLLHFEEIVELEVEF